MWISVGSSAAEPDQQIQGPPRLGPSFRLLMQARALVTALTLFSLPQEQVSGVSVLLIIGLTFVYWLAAHYWERIVPQVVAHPLLTGIDIFVSFAVLTFEGPSGPFFQSTVLASAIAGLLFRWRGMLLVSISQITCYVAALGYYSQLVKGQAPAIDSFQTLFSQPLYYPIIGLVGVMLRRLFDEQAASESARRRAELHTVAANERARLAREMHDSLAKTLRGIAMSAQALPIWVHKSPARATTEAQRIASSAEVASREARELISDLRDDQVQEPLVATVRRVTRNWSESSGIDVNISLDETADPPLLARYEIVAILKEALVNIERHAQASSVDVALSGSREALTLTISDDGVGFDTSPESPDWLDKLARAGHYGVVGMHERAKRSGARLDLTSAPACGTTLTIVFPYERLPEQPADVEKHQTAEAG